MADRIKGNFLTIVALQVRRNWRKALKRGTAILK
jgi:hypothetical protein